MNEKLMEAEFGKALAERQAEAEKLGITDKRLAANCEKYGSVSAVKEVLHRKEASDTFPQLTEAGRVDLTVEALVVEGRFGALFDDEEVNKCLDNLCAVGYFQA